MNLNKILTKRINFIFLFLCFFPLLSVIASLPVILLTLTAGVTEFDFYFKFVIPQLFYPLTTMLAVLPVPKIIGLNLKTVFPVSSFKASDFFLCAMLFMGFSTFFTFCSDAVVYILEKVGISVPPLDVFITLPSTALEIVAFIFVLVILPSVCEEIIFRGVLLNSIKTLNPKAAVIISALAFGIMHGTIQQIPFGFALGILLGIICIKFNSIIIPIILHFINNLIASFLMLLPNYITKEAYDAIYNSYNAVTLILGVFALYLFIKKQHFAFSDNPPLKTGKAIASAFRSVTLWIFIIIYLIITVSILKI